MMSSTGEPEYGRATPAAQQVLFAPRPAGRAGFIAATERELVRASRRYPDPDALRELAARTYSPAGTARQVAAMVLAGDRADRLRAVPVRTPVIHGTDDTLIGPDGGRRTADLVPDSTLLIVPDVGHDRPRPLWSRLIDAIAKHTG